MQYQVPQFIEVEDKIFGPLTFKQFIYVVGGAGASYIIYRFFPFFLAIPSMIDVSLLALGLAFYKVNNRPFAFMLESSLKYFISNKLYIWKRTEKKTEDLPKIEDKQQTPINLPRMSSSRLKDIAWSLDVQEKIRK